MTRLELTVQGDTDFMLLNWSDHNPIHYTFIVLRARFCEHGLHCNACYTVKQMLKDISYSCLILLMVKTDTTDVV